MPRFIESIETVADTRLKIGKPKAKIQIQELGNKTFNYNPTSTATDDGGKSTIKPTSLANANPVLPGAWENVSRATRYYNKQGEITVPVREFFDVFAPTKAIDFEIDISAAGYTQVPINPQVTAMRTTGQTANNTPKANVKSVTTTKIIVDITEPNAAGVTVLNVKVGASEPMATASAATLAATQLSVRVIGI